MHKYVLFKNGVVVVSVVLLLTSVAQTSPPPDPTGATDSVRRWNAIAMDANALDHTPPGHGEQAGPGRSARAQAIVHIAIFDAVNAIAHRYQLYTRIADGPASASIDAAVAQAAHDTLVALFPAQAETHDKLLAVDLAAIKDTPEKAAGIRVGRRAARAILAAVADDGSNHAEPLIGAGFEPSDQPGFWRMDPISQIPVALGAYWGSVRPLVINSVERFRAPVPPALTSRAYARAFDEVQRLGGDGDTTPTERTEDQTLAGLFWAYDGVPYLGTPPRLYNQIVVQLADQMGTDQVDLSRLLALVNVSMSDAGIACWESKYFYQTWRPVTGIREADEGTGPTGLGDGNPRTHGDPTFSPLGAPASNIPNGTNFTPPFPAYPSGHATFGAAAFQVLRNVYQTDAIPFTFVSDELNGKTTDNQGVVRVFAPRTFANLSQAEEENGQSRIYLGIHWACDKTAGIAQGRRIADAVTRRAFLPR